MLAAAGTCAVIWLNLDASHLTHALRAFTTPAAKVVLVTQLSFPAYAFNTDDKTAAVSVLMAQIDPANAGRYNSDSQVPPLIIDVSNLFFTQTLLWFPRLSLCGLSEVCGH
jgi:hypothetical protein